MAIRIEAWLYGPIARYAKEGAEGYARLDLELPAGSTLADLVRQLGIPAEERGITFINGNLAALPGMNVDHKTVLQDGDRVGLFHRRSMWPFQYRFGAAVRPELQEALRRREDGGIRHSYK
ncbi:MAG TPA: MoaD/ThiS family protein [Thermoflexia bacterium]|jgi:sulfur carrier protein ThiS|nr:MoaD/ThiS family protein [Thermoflexia bacterium]